jgi:hypothetical protein
MKIITFTLIALLTITLGAGAFFFLNLYTPMAEDYARIKAGLPEFDKAKAELKKLKDKDAQHAKEVAWITPAADVLSNGLADEIKAGKAEVVSSGNALVINILENALYTPESKTFAKDTQTRLKVTGLLKHDALKGRDIFVGNTTEAVVAHGKGRKKVPAKEALALASERSFEMVKALVRDGVPQESLAALAYPAKLPDRGFKIKNRKTMIVIGTYPSPAAPQTPTAPIPVQPVQPK